MDYIKTIFNYKDEKYDLKIEICIPFEDSIEEYVHIYLNNNDFIPIYLEKEIITQLSEFVQKNNIVFYNQLSTEVLDVFKENLENIEEIISRTEDLMKEEIVEYAERRCASDEELFATAYHKMVHSPALETMLQLEYMYGKTVRQKNDEKNNLIQMLSKHQSEEMNEAVDRLEKDMTETKINKLVGKHYEAHSLLKVKLTSELDTIKEAQRREYREWLMQMLEQKQAMNSIPTPSSPLTPVHSESILPILNSRSNNNLKNKKFNKFSNLPLLEESFTIHLGSQLKQMHNIRILSGNVMEFCTVEDSEEQTCELKPQLIQTALALYSNDLCGLVLITDNKIGSRSTNEFQNVCNNTTEFHFDDIYNQFESISLMAKRLSNRCDSVIHRKNKGSSDLLQAGDFYMTRHSNLAQVHIIFHIVTDDSIRGNDINSRHPMVLGLRNILKTACANDITSLTIPLLLQYDMSEEMTVSWCEKRAELVFKCVKGFMIEMASWGGSDLKNLQFMLPQGISVQVFQSLTDMLPRIFKLSNPKILK